MNDTKDNHSLHVLEFDAILSMLAERTTCLLGREIALSLTPGTDPTIINDKQTLVSEVVKILRSRHSIPIRGIKDIRNALGRARVEGSSIDPEGLLDVKSTLQTSRLLSRFGRSLHGEFPVPRVESLLAGMGDFQAIETEIENAIDEGGSVKDRASPALAKIRREQHAVRERTRDHLNKIMQSETGQKALQDQVVTVRDGRYVLPVRTDHKKQVKGVVHDQSASGATIFIEPMAVVEMNNELRGLEVEEVREIDRILSAITAVVGDRVEEISRSYALLGLMDFNCAAAQFSLDLQASQPRFNLEGRIELRNARHPLLSFSAEDELPATAVVPLTLEMGKDKSTLVITGPNMGGKTVALKTVGLLTLMAQAGLHIPADEPSDLVIFRRVYADIGDEQSIQANLSTFSSHLRHIVDILEEADDESLILLDELGSGTDPSAGAAMGMATLESLTERGSTTIATTHYGALKEFASRAKRVENGSMAFDVQTLGPTYRFRQGIPGGSYGLEIGQRLGVPEDVLSRTAEIIGQDERTLDDLITELDRERQAHESTREQMEDRSADLERLVSEYEERISSYQQKEKELIDDARTEAERLINDANATIERAVADIRSEQASRASIVRAKEAVTSQRAQLRQLIADSEPAPEGHTVSPGDRVWVSSLNQDATVVQAPDSANRVRVRTGNLELSVRLEEVQVAGGSPVGPPSRKPSPPKKTAASPVQARPLVVDIPQIDVRGYTAEEAIEAVDRYIDQSMLEEQESVSILHGKGTGVLRKELGTFLQNHQLVKSTRFAPQREGGNGVTIVELVD